MTMKNTTSMMSFDKIYSSSFSITVFVLLIFFAFSRDLSLSTMAENFRWRTGLIDIYTSLRLKMGDRVYTGAVMGNDGWIFYTQELSIPDYQNTIPMSRKKLSSLQKELDQLNQELNDKGITLILVVPPNKTTVYSQYMPYQIPVLNEKSRLDQFVEYMKRHGRTAVVDLRTTLRKASLSYDVYHKADTHWNSLGAYYGYVEIMNVLSADYPDLKPHPLSDFEYKSIGYSRRDLTNVIGLQGYEDENWILIPRFNVQVEVEKIGLPDGWLIRIATNPDKRLPRLLVYRDSFYGALAQFIEPHFSETIGIPFSYEEGVWSLDWIEREKPDVVIIEIVERFIDTSLPLLFSN